MSTILVFAMLGPISWFYHPDCHKAQPGTYAILMCDYYGKHHRPKGR